MSDQRHWITNPAGHRASTQELQTHQTGDLVDTPLGEAVFINTDTGLELDAWFCDYCNRRILTRWGEEPWPVAADATDALCDTCRQRVEEGPEFSDHTGEPVDGSQAGPWPPHACNCPPCRNTTTTWAAAGYFTKAAELGWQPG